MIISTGVSPKQKSIQALKTFSEKLQKKIFRNVMADIYRKSLRMSHAKKVGAEPDYGIFISFEDLFEIEKNFYDYQDKEEKTKIEQP